MGTQCERQYEKIDHAANTTKKRVNTFKARLSVLQIFRKAVLCNGMYGARRSDQARFNAREEGHIDAINNLLTNMKHEGDMSKRAARALEDRYKDMQTDEAGNFREYDFLSDLQSISIRKQQCK